VWYSCDEVIDVRGEEWRPVVGFEGLYEVSDFGRVRSVGRVVARGNNQIPIPERILKQSTLKQTERHPSVRKNVELWKNGERKRCPVSRLVCKAFVENPDNKPHVNHIDGNSENDHASNLEWVTAKENNAHAHRLGLISRESSRRKVRGTHHKTGEVVEFDSLTDAAKRFGVTKGAIGACIHGYGRAKRCKGFSWEFLS